MIDLLNRRFVAFYFNVGKQGHGYDADAAAFIAQVDKRFAGNRVPTPPVWVFSPDGKLLATIDNYAPKEKFFASLKKVLDEHAAFNAPNVMERKIVREAAEAPQDADAQFKAAQIHEQLGDYDKALQGFAAVETLKPDGSLAYDSVLRRARIHRYRGEWEAAAKLLDALAPKIKDGSCKAGDAFAAERGHRLLHDKNFAGSRAVLEQAIKAHPDSSLMGELRFYAGVACFLGGEPKWAHYHWGWAMTHIPGDHYYMRCYMAMTAAAMPYPNPELNGFRGKSGMISHAIADRARDQAMEDYEALKEKF